MAGLNINDAPITFNAIVLEDLHTSFEGLVNQLIIKYRGEAFRQIHLVVGSADFIGNPVGLFTNISAGVQDVFYEPYHGLLMGDGIQDLGIGLAKGARSLLTKTVYSVSDSLSKFTGSVSKGILIVGCINFRAVLGDDGFTVPSKTTFDSYEKPSKTRNWRNQFRCKGVWIWRFKWG